MFDYYIFKAQHVITLGRLNDDVVNSIMLYDIKDSKWVRAYPRPLKGIPLITFKSAKPLSEITAFINEEYPELFL